MSHSLFFWFCHYSGYCWPKGKRCILSSTWTGDPTSTHGCLSPVSYWEVKTTCYEYAICVPLILLLLQLLHSTYPAKGWYSQDLSPCSGEILGGLLKLGLLSELQRMNTIAGATMVFCCLYTSKRNLVTEGASNPHLQSSLKYIHSRVPPVTPWYCFQHKMLYSLSHPI